MLLLRVDSGMPLRATRISAHHGISQAQHFITQHYLLCSVRTTTRDFFQIAQNLSHHTSALLFTITTATNLLDGILPLTHFPDQSFRRLFSLTLTFPTYCVQLLQNSLYVAKSLTHCTCTTCTSTLLLLLLVISN